MVSQSDIAREVGTSVATVSRILSGKSGRFSQKSELARKVVAVSERMGYRLNVAGRTLRTKKFNQIGILFYSTTEPLYSDLMPLLQSRIFAHGYASVCGFWKSYDDAENAIRSVVMHGVDGVITCHEPELVAPLAKEIPIVYFMWEPSFSDSVAIDGLGLVLSSIRHMRELGHTRISLVGISDASGSIVTSVARSMGGELSFVDLDCTELYLGARAELDAYLSDVVSQSARTRPTALICRNDYVALLVMSGLIRRGIRIPRDISIMGSNATSVGSLITPSLTSIGAPVDILAKKLVNAMFYRLKNPDAPPQHIRVETRLFPRESTADVRSRAT